MMKLFHSRRISDNSSSGSAIWRGESGTEYEYEVYPLGAVFRSLPGNFIYAKQARDGAWIPIYIGETRDLDEPLAGDVRLEDAVGNGASHLHVHHCSAAKAARCAEERDLILRWQPVCNDQMDV